MLWPVPECPEREPWYPRPEGVSPMSLTHHEVSDRQVAANHANAQKSTGWIRKSEPAKPESLFEAATSNMAMRSPSPIPKREAKGPTAEVASSAIAKTPGASDGAQPNGRNKRPKPECNLESTTCTIADVVERPIAKVNEAGTRPNGRNARAKPECNLESATYRIAHAAGRPIAKTTPAADGRFEIFGWQTFFERQSHQIVENTRQCPESDKTIPISDTFGSLSTLGGCNFTFVGGKQSRY